MTSQAVLDQLACMDHLLHHLHELYSGTLIEGTLCRELFGRGHIWG